MLSLYELGRSGELVCVMTLTVAVGNNRFDRQTIEKVGILSTFFKHNWTVDSFCGFSLECILV